MSFFKKWFKSGDHTADGSAKSSDIHPIHSLVTAFQRDPAHEKMQWLSEDQAKEIESFQRIISMPPHDQSIALLFTLEWLGKDETQVGDPYRRPRNEARANQCARLVISLLLRRSLPWDEHGFTALCHGIQNIGYRGYPEPRALFPAAATRYKKQAGEFSRDQLEILNCICHDWDKQTGEAGTWAKKLNSLLGTTETAPSLRVFRNGEVFAERLLDDWESMSEPERNAWSWILSHAADCSASKPTSKWSSRAKELIGKIGENAFNSFLITWLPLIDKPAGNDTLSASQDSMYRRRHHAMEICEPHLDAIKGLVWMACLLNNDELTRVIGFVGVSSYKKIPNIGSRATRVGNACVWALANIRSDTALSQLAMMKVRVKFGSAQIAIGKALQTLADARGVTPEELEEMSVPSYGMTQVGRMDEPLGEYTAILEVIDDKPVLSFIKPDGSPQKSVPAAVKEQHSNDFKEFKGTAQDIEKMLSAQKERLDHLFLLRKTWPYTLWRERYLDHPLVGIMARRLIWSFRSSADDPPVSAIWHDGGLCNSNGARMEPAEESTVELWHPIHSDASEIVRWRSWLFEHLIRQPFKQAHREIYILTDAERTTGTYSNRFAAHILKQHQFNSLCAARGWKNKLRLMVDDTYPPATRLLPEWGLRAEYWIEGVGDDYTEEYVIDSGAYRYLVTDQVRFYRIDSTQATAHAGGGGYNAGWGRTPEDPLPIESIPQIVLSEVLRDVDLFVGVTSVGNDPAWSDGGPGGRHENYWTHYSFGELGESAKLRMELISMLLPRLKIAKQCHISGRFLVVNGALRTYKIHLGSGNILMEPDDRYLCIVKAPASYKGNDMFLPFEGDSKLSMILSKAFLLAADTKITDPTILSQIRTAQ